MYRQIFEILQYAQLLTRNDIQLPGGAFVNVCALGYLSGKQTSQRIVTAPEYTAIRYLQA